MVTSDYSCLVTPVTRVAPCRRHRTRRSKVSLSGGLLLLGLGLARHQRRGDVVLDDLARADDLGAALVAGGLPVAEVTFRTPAAGATGCSASAPT